MKVGGSDVVGDLSDESVSELESSDNTFGGIDSGGELRVVREGVVRRGRLIAACLFASCLVSKGTVVDGFRDSLAVFSRCCHCQKKSERLLC